MSNRIILTEDGVEKEITSDEIKGLRIVFVGGDNNEIRIDKSDVFQNCSIQIFGNDNVVAVGQRCSITNTIFNLRVSAADRRHIVIGERCHINDSIFDVPYSDDKLTLGKNCFLKSKVRLHTQDGHTIFDIESKKAVNRGCAIEIGDHVFIGINAFIGKNVSIKSNTVVLPCSNVIKNIEQGNVLIGGNPAKVLRSNIGFRPKEVKHVKSVDNR